MSNSEATATDSFLLGDLIALSDEIVALSRAGVPLEKGLKALGGDMPGRLGATARDLARQTSEGTPLEEALASHPQTFPPVYRAVIRAGMKAGRLSAAIEGLADWARRLIEMHRATLLASLYPMFIVLLAYGLFVAFVVWMAPDLYATFAEFGLKQPAMIVWCNHISSSAIYSAPALPTALVMAWAAWWIASRKTWMLQPSWTVRVFGWIPWIKRISYYSQAATTTDLLALLLRHGEPLHTALPLAAEPSGNARFIADASALAEKLEAGHLLAAVDRKPGGLPSSVMWLLQMRQSPEALVNSLESTANEYRRRAADIVQRSQTLLPVLLTVCVGGTVTLIYALALVTPWFTFLKSSS